VEAWVQLPLRPTIYSKEVNDMYVLCCAVRVIDGIEERKVGNNYRYIEDARKVAESVKDIVAYRVFDEAGIRIYSKRVEIKG
jgi:hypothetical protein